jgi:hypothetical protein
MLNLVNILLIKRTIFLYPYAPQYTIKQKPKNATTMLTQISIGILFLVVTVLLQSLSFDLIIHKTSWLLNQKIKALKIFWKAIILASVTLSVACVLISEVFIWGLFYYFCGILPDFETSLYFSMSSFTTVGFGDVYLDKNWRLLSSIESLNGFIMFGWATAFIFEIVSRVYKKEAQQIKA